MLFLIFLIFPGKPIAKEDNNQAAGESSSRPNSGRRLLHQSNGETKANPDQTIKLRPKSPLPGSQFTSMPALNPDQTERSQSPKVGSPYPKHRAILCRPISDPLDRLGARSPAELEPAPGELFEQTDNFVWSKVGSRLKGKGHDRRLSWSDQRSVSFPPDVVERFEVDGLLSGGSSPVSAARGVQQTYSHSSPPPRKPSPKPADKSEGYFVPEKTEKDKQESKNSGPKDEHFKTYYAVLRELKRDFP